MTRSYSETPTGTSNRGNERSVGLDLPGSALAFAVKRRVDPAGAFDDLVARLTTAIDDDPAVAAAFGEISNFDLAFVQGSDTDRLEELKTSGTEFHLKVGTLPEAIGPGLTVLYDAALNTLATSDQPIDPDWITARTVGRLTKSFDSFVEMIGSASVQATEMSRAGKDVADRLESRAQRLGEFFERAVPPTGPCEFCTITQTDRDGNIVAAFCGTEQQCRSMGILALVLILVLLLGWITGWF